MITCTHCGNANADTRAVCQFCGASLSRAMNRGEGGPGFQQSVQPQHPVQPTQTAQSAQASELPAWLESLRSDAPMRSSDPSSFSAADFMEEGDLPRWMQSNNTPEKENDPKPPTSGLRSSSSSAPNTDEGGYVRNISAHDLIDEQMLPSWMRAESSIPLDEQRNISASSLIQQDSVPDWMRTFPQGQPGQVGQAGQPGQFNQPAAPSAPTPSYQSQAPQGYPASPLSAHDLIDHQALPAWLQEQGSQQNGQQGQAMGSNPNWNAPNQGRSGGDVRGSDVQGAQAQGFSASSLVDMNALPAWMSEGGQVSGPSYQQQGQGQPMPSQQPASQQGGMSASSFIDVNALPDWLRAASEQGQAVPRSMPASPNQGGMYGGGGYAESNQGYGPSPRQENMRVPSRPRGEPGTNEGSEAAANAFASMLGVASHAPQFSQGTPYAGQQSVQSGPQMQQMSQMPPSSPQYPNNSFAAQTPVNNGQVGQQTPYMNSIGVAQMPPSPGMQPMGGPPMQNAAQYNQMQQMPQMQQGQQGQSYQQHQPQPSSQLSQQKSPKRGGLFEAIRNFFFR